MKDEELSQSISENLTSVLYDPSPKGDMFDKTLFAIEMELQRVNRLSGRWVKKCVVDFTQDEKVVVMVETTPHKPLKWSCADLGTFLTSVAQALRVVGVLIYGLTIEYDKPPQFSIGDHPMQRQACCDLKKFPKKVDYRETLKQLVFSFVI